MSSVDVHTTRELARQHKSDLLRSLRMCTLEGIMAMPLVTMSLPVNVFMTALVAKAYALPKTTIGSPAPQPPPVDTPDRGDREAGDRKSTRLNSSHTDISRMPSSA